MHHIAKLMSVLILILLAGCSQQPTQTTNIKPTPVEKLQETHIKELLSKAWQTTSPTEAASLRLRAVKKLHKNNQFEQSISVYKLITPENLTNKGLRDYVYLGLILSSLSADESIAKTALAYDSESLFTNLPMERALDVQKKRQAAHELLTNHLQSALIRIKNAATYTEDIYWQNHESIWKNLSASELNELVKENTPAPSNYELAGWLDLVIMIKQSQYNLDKQLSALQQWQQMWPDHPASIKLPKELEILASLPEKRPESITLALPLSGPLANAGKAVHEGFMAAYYSDPFRNKHKTAISLVDSAKSDNFYETYLEISSKEPDLIIGPLDKKDVNELSVVPHLPVPVLALNYQSQETLIPQNFFQFGLSNEDEIQQLINHMWNKGIRQIINLCPNNQWGKRSCATVKENWEKINGVILETTFFEPKGEHTKLIENTFRVNESKQRARKLNQILPKRVETTHRRRQDIEAIVLLSRPQNARQLKPLFSFFYGGNIPVFSTSTIYTGQINKTKDQDLNGITFTETPWVLSRTNHLKGQLHNKQPKLATHYDRLFALGADAYLLAPRLSIFDIVKTTSVNGNTGLLKMDENKKIIRTLDWARIIDGEAKADSSI